MRMCGMEHPSTGSRCQASDCRDRESGHSDYNMQRASKYLGSLFLVAALAAPVTILAARATQEGHERNRRYDKDHRDYHNWVTTKTAPGGGC